jgi:hypothetical protein
VSLLKEMREMERKLKWNFCFFCRGRRQKLEKKKTRELQERKKKSKKNRRWGEREKNNFLKKVKIKNYYFNDIRND